MRYQTLIYMALKNISYKKLRTALTVMGVVIGIGAIVFLVSFALGLRNTVNKQVVGSETVKTLDVTSPDSGAIHLNNANLALFGKLSHVKQVSRTYIVPGTISFDGSTSNSIVYGTDGTYLQLLAPKVMAGKITIDRDSTVNAVVNQALLKSIGITKADKALNKKITIRTDLSQAVNGKAPAASVTVTVTGVISSSGGAEIYTNGAFIRKALSFDYTQAKVVVDGQSNVQAVRDQIGARGFTTQSPLDTINQINKLFNIFAILLAGFGGIGMIIAVLGMFNTLTISLLERTSEIGLMMSIGARRRDIRRLFMFEALALSLMGGLGGLIGAWTIGEIVNIILSTLAGSRGLSGGIHIFSVPYFLSGAAILFVLLVGYVVVFFPARRAARINPIDALKHE
jgi:putative ABC transport system permease protein